MVIGVENVFSLEKRREEDKPATPTNEYGIVIPPVSMECQGETCPCRRENDSCAFTCHHLHSTKPYYENDEDQASKFRELSVLTVWIPDCQHRNQHDKYKVVVPIPRPEIMQQCIRETRWLKKINANRKNLSAARREYIYQEFYERQTKGLKRRIDDLLDEKEELIDFVGKIEVIPEQLVTGSLLVAAPEVAQTRIADGSPYVLTGMIEKEEIPAAVETAEKAYAVAA